MWGLGLTDSVDILSDTTMSSGRKIIINHMHHVSDIKTASSNTSGNQDGAFGNFEGATVERFRESEIEDIRGG